MVWQLRRVIEYARYVLANPLQVGMWSIADDGTPSAGVSRPAPDGAEMEATMSRVLATLGRLGFITVALCTALTMTIMSVAAADPVPGQITVTGSPMDPQGLVPSGVVYPSTTASVFDAADCDDGNFSCLAANGVVYPYGVPVPYATYAGYPGVVPSASYPVNGVVNPGVAPQNGYAVNYNYNYRYYGIPDAYFTSNGCAVGNYTCLFSKFGNGATVPVSFFAAIGCAPGDYACATNQSVFTNAGCTIGNYTCVYTKTGKNP